PNELESLLRIYDIDSSSLPPRLQALLLTNVPMNIQRLRNVLTTESMDLPSPSMLPTRDLSALMKSQSLAAPQANPVASHITDLRRARLPAGGLPVASIPAAMAAMLPYELVASQRMDLNRPFGNGYDDNNNGIVDEPGEAETQTWNTAAAGTPGTFNGYPPD